MTPTVVEDAARPGAMPSVVPASRFEELSGSEQEAVLDLLDENAWGQASLSI